MEQLTNQIVKEYQERAARIPPNGLQDIGERRSLRIELQNRCGLSEIEAVNILNGRNAKDYIAIYRMKMCGEQPQPVTDHEPSEPKPEKKKRVKKKK